MLRINGARQTRPLTIFVLAARRPRFDSNPTISAYCYVTGVGASGYMMDAGLFRARPLSLLLQYHLCREDLPNDRRQRARTPCVRTCRSDKSVDRVRSAELTCIRAASKSLLTRSIRRSPLRTLSVSLKTPGVLDAAQRTTPDPVAPFLSCLREWLLVVRPLFDTLPFRQLRRPRSCSSQRLPEIGLRGRYGLGRHSPILNISAPSVAGGLFVAKGNAF